jgi:hypothetical protein
VRTIDEIFLSQSVTHFIQKGKIPKGITELPFEVDLKPTGEWFSFPQFERNLILSPGDQKRLFETYHGVFVNVQYNITCDLFRTFLAKNLQKKIEFIVEVTTPEPPKATRVDFTITPQVSSLLAAAFPSLSFSLPLSL